MQVPVTHRLTNNYLGVSDGDLGVPNLDNSDVQVPFGLLPPIAVQHRGRLCLVLDLDETLIHSSFRPYPCDLWRPSSYRMFHIRSTWLFGGKISIDDIINQSNKGNCPSAAGLQVKVTHFLQTDSKAHRHVLHALGDDAWSRSCRVQDAGNRQGDTSTSRRHIGRILFHLERTSPIFYTSTTWTSADIGVYDVEENRKNVAHFQCEAIIM